MALATKCDNCEQYDGGEASLIVSRGGSLRGDYCSIACLRAACDRKLAVIERMRAQFADAKRTAVSA